MSLRRSALFVPLAAALLAAPPASARKGDSFRKLHSLSSPDQPAPEAMSTRSLGAWVGFRNGFQNTGRSPVEARPLFQAPSARQPWAYQTQGLIWGTPVVGPEGHVYVGSADKNFYCLDADGAERWRYTLPDEGDSLVDSAATFTPNGLVVVPGGDGTLHALDRQTGQMAWTFDAYHAGDHDSGAVVNSFEGNVVLGPDGNLYAGNDNGHFYSLDLDGNERWNFATGMMIWSAAGFAPDGSWVAFASLDNHLYVLSTEDGSLLAKHKFAGEVKASPVVDAEGRIYIGGSDFTVRCLELTAGTFYGQKLKRHWTYKTSGDIYSSMALADGKLVLGSHDGYLHCLTTSGELVWKYGVHDRVSGSPLITADGVVVVGAKNGKLYAVDLQTGERIWSFKAAPGERKTNLDSSPAMDATGRIYLGCYDGNVYSVPVEYPIQHPQDPRVDLAPGNDVPDFSAPPNDGATLRVLGEGRRYHVAPPKPIDTQAPLTFRVVAHEEGAYVPNAAIAVVGLKVTVDPPTPLQVVLASDSYRLNVYPERFWEPDTTYTIRVQGRVYHRGNPFVDLVKYWNLSKLDYQASFTTGPAAAPLPQAAPGSTLRYQVRGLYAIQPEVLDTLIPAALDGQAFLASAPFVDRAKGRVGMVVLPGFPQPDGSVSLRAAPEKSFAMTGDLAGGAVRANGKLTMAAMGGTIPFSPFRMSGRLTEEGIEAGRFFATADVWRIKGNGGTYTGVSWQMLDDLADAKLRLQAMGTMEGKRLAPLEHPAARTREAWSGAEELTVELRLAAPVTGEHLVSVAYWDAEAAEVVAMTSARFGQAGATTPAGNHAVRLEGIRRRDVAGLQQALLFDGELVPEATP